MKIPCWMKLRRHKLIEKETTVRGIYYAEYTECGLMGSPYFYEKMVKEDK